MWSNLLRRIRDRRGGEDVMLDPSPYPGLIGEDPVLGSTHNQPRRVDAKPV
jgi:hypothetical protein